MEGTGCLYLREGGQSDRVFLLTARHVVLSPAEYTNSVYHRKDNKMPRCEVIHLGDRAFQRAIGAIENRIVIEGHAVDDHEVNLERLRRDGQATDTQKVNAETKLAEVKASLARVTEFHSEIGKFWPMNHWRVLGHVLYAPPISVSVGTGDEKFTQDWALVELDRRMFNWPAFQGNIIPLGAFCQSIPLRSFG